MSVDSSLLPHRFVGALCRLALPTAMVLSSLACSDASRGPSNPAIPATGGSGQSTLSTSSESSATVGTTTDGGGSDSIDTSVTSTVGSGGATESASAGGGGGAVSTVDGSGGIPSGGSSASGGSGGGGAPVTWPLVNGIQWADSAGNPIQAHGGGMLKVGEDYYWFGENRNPNGTFFAVSAYRSRDLRRWEAVGDVLTLNSDEGLNPANVERPKVVYNEATQKYVMWMHWENGMDYGEARAAVASSDTVDGEYVYHGSFRPLQDSGVMDHGKPGHMSRDCTLFVDDDGQAYFLSSSNENTDLNLYLLSNDYLSVDSLAAVLFPGGHREAPALFKRGETYFLVTSAATGWDPNQAQYATSTSLTTGWSNLQNVANSTTFYSQSTYVQAVQGSSGTQYLYMGDRWAGAWGGRVNDSSYVWQPIEFSSATTMSMSDFNTLDIDAALGTVSGKSALFVLVNEKSGMLLSVAGAADQNSADVIQNTEDLATSFVWRLTYDGAGYFRLVNDDGGKVLDVPDESVEPSIALHLWDDNGGDHQAWRPIDLGAGRYRIVNKNSGLFLGVAAGSTEAAAAVEQQTDSGGDEQVWQLVVAE